MNDPKITFYLIYTLFKIKKVEFNSTFNSFITEVQIYDY